MKKIFSTLFTLPEEGSVRTEESVVRERGSELVLINTDMEHLTVRLANNFTPLISLV